MFSNIEEAFKESFWSGWIDKKETLRSEEVLKSEGERVRPMARTNVISRSQLVCVITFTARRGRQTFCTAALILLRETNKHTGTSAASKMFYKKTI